MNCTKRDVVATLLPIARVVRMLMQQFALNGQTIILPLLLNMY